MTPENILFVNWNLIDACNYNCAYCPSPAHTGDSVYMLERLKRMAEKILSLPREYYAITLGGGEPTLHPFLADIASYFLLARRPVALRIETNGSQEPAYYERLIGKLPGKPVNFALTVHPAFLDINKLLAQIVSMIKSGESVSVRVVDDPDQREKHEKLISGLRKLQQSLPFSLESANLSRPGDGKPLQMDTVAGSAYGMSPAAPASDAARIVSSVFAFEKNISARPPLPDSPYCLHGSNALYIEPNGHYYGAKCATAHSAWPLWHENANIESAIKLVKCPYNSCKSDPLNLLKKYATEAEAQNSYEALKDQALFWRHIYGSSGTDSKRLPDAVEVLRARLKRLAPSSDGREGFINLQRQEDIAWRNMDRIARIHHAFNDGKSRDIFLRCVRALESGDPAYLPPASQIPPSASAPENARFPVEIAPEEAVTASDIDAMGADIRKHLPGLKLKLAMNGRDFLGALERIIKIYPDYALELAFDGEQIILLARHPRQPELHPLLSAKEDLARPHLSIALCIGNADSEKGIEKSVDSILAQDIGSLEIIIVDNASSDESRKIISQRQMEFPDFIKPVFIDTAVSFGEALDRGFQAATGRRIIFMRAGDSLKPGILRNALQAMDEVAAEALIFSGRRDSASASSPRDNFRDYLALRAEGMALSDYILDMDFLAIRNIHPRDCLHPDFQLVCEAMGKSARVRYLQGESGGTRQEETRGVSGAIPALAKEIGVTREMIAEIGLSPGDEAFIKWETGIIRDWLPEIVAWAQDKPGDDLALMRSLGVSAPILKEILASFARSFAEDSASASEIDERDEDWRLAAARIQSPISYSPYGQADAAIGQTPMVSVIMPNFNKAPYIRESVEAVLGQTFPDFELIIVDDHSTDGSWEILCDYADFNSRIRLYRMNGNCRQGICRNVALDRARGKYLVFADSDDILAQGFLEHAVELMESKRADLGIYSWIHVDDNLKKTGSQKLADGILSREKAYALYAEGKIDAGPCSKIFRHSAVRDAGARFREFAYHEDYWFVLPALLNAAKIVASSFEAGAIRLSANSTIRPAKWRYLTPWSSVRVFEFFDQIAALRGLPNLWSKHIAWNLRTLFLPALAAFMRATGELPLTDEDLRLLSSNGLFLDTLFKQFASSGAQLPEISGRDNSGANEDREPHIEDNGFTQEMAPEFIGGGLADKHKLRATALLRRYPWIDIVAFAPASHPSGLQAPAPGFWKARELAYEMDRRDCLPLDAGHCILNPQFLARLEKMPNPDGVAGPLPLRSLIGSAGTIYLAQDDSLPESEFGLTGAPDTRAMLDRLSQLANCHDCGDLPEESAVAAIGKIMWLERMDAFLAANMKDLPQFFDSISENPLLAKAFAYFIKLAAGQPEYKGRNDREAAAPERVDMERNLRRFLSWRSGESQ